MTPDHALAHVVATRYVLPLREGGSLPALIEADDDGLYVVKFHGAGQGPLALVAEVVAGELARAIGLHVPELVTVEVDPALATAEPDPEIKELVGRSAGLNLGVDFLPGALGYAPAGAWQPDASEAAAIVWLDALVMNVDRTARNPNLLHWHDRLWLIDHGAALYLHHGGALSAKTARRPFPQIAEHVLLPRADSLLEAHARLAPLLSGGMLEGVLASVPSEWLAPADAAQYVDYLERRGSGAEFAEEAERARLDA